MKAEFIHVMLG